MKSKSVALALAAVAVMAGSARAQERIDERRSTSPTGTVEVHNLAGSVRVTAWNRNEVAVSGTLGQNAERVDVTNEGSRVVVRVVQGRGRNTRGTVLEVRVPERKDLRVNTTSAAVSVNGVGGEVEVHSVSGGIEVRGGPREVTTQSRSGDVTLEVDTRRVDAGSVSGDISVGGRVSEGVSAASVSGEVRVTAPTGQVRASSVSGGVTVASMTGRAEVSSVSGDVRVTGRRLSGSFGTVSGVVVLSGDLERNGSIAINTHSGDVELRIGSGASAEVDVTTFSGGIDVQLSNARVTRSSRRNQRIVIGGGDARVNVHTFSGDVKLTGR